MTTIVTAPPSTLVEIGELIRTRPGFGAPTPVVAAWYERKAVVLGHIAAESGDRDAEECSRIAHEHAITLLTGGGSR
jgi:hypothetical protein